MSQMPLISIVIANYNYGRFLEDAIRSVITQNLGEKVELIICDAASADNSIDVIKKYAKGLPPNTPLEEWRSRQQVFFEDSFCQEACPSIITGTTLITWWCSEHDDGQSAAFNKGFAHARGRFLTWLNADDILLPGALSIVLRSIEQHPKCKWFVGGTARVDKNLIIRDIAIPHRFSWRRIASRDITVGGPSSFFTKDLFDIVGGCDVNLRYSMDVDLWVKFAIWAKESYRRVPGLLWGFRNHEDSKTTGCLVAPQSFANRSMKVVLREERLKRLQRFGPPSRFVRMIQYVPISILDIISCKLLRKKYIGKDARSGVFSFDLCSLLYWRTRM